MTLEQLNALMNWIREIAQYEAAQSVNVSEDGWPISDEMERRERAALIEAFGFEMGHGGEAQVVGTNEAYQVEREARYRAMRATMKAEARKKKSAKRKAKL